MTVLDTAALVRSLRPAPTPPPDFELNCQWQPHGGHPHLSVGYVIVDGQTVWGVYICSATYLTPGNEWSFTLPLSFEIQQVISIALSALAWDRFMVVESERPAFDEAAKHAIVSCLETIAQHSRPCKLVSAIAAFLGE
jgi:hypothetical protein